MHAVKSVFLIPRMANSTRFISADDFQKHKEPRILSWVDVPTDKIWRVLNITSKEAAHGTAYILHLADEQERRMLVWCSQLLVRDIFEKRSEKQQVFLISLGQKIRKNGKKLNLYELTFDDTDRVIKIFDDVSKAQIEEDD